MDGSSEKIQFSWGKLRAKGGVNMDTQFYESFTFDNVEYSLYDCVYLFKNGDPEPYVGKIVKIWQQNQAKKVKILWFFLPDEIRTYLGGPVMEKEIFLASGEGIGLANINPLEAIAGKCTVICISKDERNRQPSHREQAMADYIFYRFFDVKNCTLSDQLPDKIAGLEVNVLLNPKDEQVTSIPGAVNMDEGLVSTVPPTQSVVKEEDKSPVAAVPLSQSVVKEDQKPVAAILLSNSAIKEDQKPVASIPISQSANKEDDKPVASIPSPRSEVKKDNILKHTQNAGSVERPPKKLKFSQEVTVQNMAPAVPDKRPSELTSRKADRSKWFKIPWDERLRIADEHGTLVYIQNLDIQFGAADIEELIREALQLSCIAKPINHPTYDDPNNGKAYAIFKTKNAADAAISKINSGLVVDGRPLYCSKGLLKVPKHSGTLVGHLSTHHIKIGQKQREEQKKAVSTSHCSQPNTIEYDLALDWMLVQEKQERKFRILHKRHKDDRKGFASMGSKNEKTEK
ncbi:protein ANTI-SILENCING 1 [Phragmites australis]|uniref:protein ANTI-SILENCING 1 n=1 Tax=Phragmites australis TaxID=29695 RepID=UPI002D782D15|nr:protein ANTI-SILENCING 1 [Phragmites australis]